MVAHVHKPSTRQGPPGRVKQEDYFKWAHARPYLKQNKQKSSFTFHYDSTYRHRAPPQNQTVLLRTSLGKAGIYRRVVHPESPDTNPLPTCLSLSTEVMSSTPPRGLPHSHGDNALVGETQRLCEQTGLLSPLGWVACSLLRAVSPKDSALLAL